MITIGRSLAVLLHVLVLVAGAAAAGESAGPPDGRDPLWFSLDVGPEARRLVQGCLLRGEGEDAAYDAARIDLDGDGTCETGQAFGETVHPRSKQPMREYRLRFRVGEDLYVLEFEALRSPVYARTLAAGRTTVNWSVQRGNVFIRFIEGPLELFASAEAARGAPPFRMGGPFRLAVEAGSKGMNPTVSPALKDGNGANLGGLYREGVETRPELRVTTAGEVKVSGRPGYC